MSEVPVSVPAATDVKEEKPVVSAEATAISTPAGAAAGAVAVSAPESTVATDSVKTETSEIKTDAITPEVPAPVSALAPDTSAQGVAATEAFDAAIKIVKALESEGKLSADQTAPVLAALNNKAPALTADAPTTEAPKIDEKPAEPVIAAGAAALATPDTAVAAAGAGALGGDNFTTTAKPVVGTATAAIAAAKAGNSLGASIV